MGNMNLGALDKGDAEDVCWCVVETLASASDEVSAVLGVMHFMRDVYGYEESDEDIIPNPAFLANGHEGASPKTKKYFVGRGRKKMGGIAVSFAGGMASGATMVDVGGLLKDGSALGTSGVHLVGVKAAGKRFKRSETVTRWVDAIVLAKSMKMGVRGAGVAGAAIPIPAVGLATGIATTVAKLGIKVTLSKLIMRVSMEVHWRAYQELAIAGGLGHRGSKGGPVGPASAMFYEIFTKRSFTRIFGKHDTEMLIREPGGWMALNDKLMLM